MTKQEMVFTWARDAQAMEEGSVDLLKRYADDFEGYPQVQEKFREFSRKAADASASWKDVLERTGADTSTMKQMMGKAMSKFQSAGSELLHDQPVKHMLATYSAASMGLVSYISLAAAAESCGEEEIKNLAQQCVDKKREVLHWLEEQTPPVTLQFLDKEHDS